MKSTPIILLGVTFFLSSFSSLVGDVLDRGEMERLAEQLDRGKMVAERRKAAETLGKRAETAEKIDPAIARTVVPALVKALENDDDTMVRNHAAWALGKIKQPAEMVTPALVEALADAEWSVRHNATLSLQWIGAPSIPELEKALESEQPSTRAYARFVLIALDPSRHQEHLPVLLEQLGSDDPAERLMSVQSLTILGEHAAPGVSRIADLLQDENPDIRKTAILTLKGIGPAASGATSSLISCLKTDKERWNRVEAAIALGMLGADDPAVPDALVAAFEDKDSRVRAFSAEALGRIGEPAIPAVTKALQSESARTLRHAMMAAGAMGEKGAPLIRYLVESLQDPDQQTRITAVGALGSIGIADSDARQALLEAKAKEAADSPYRAHVEKALAMMQAGKTP